MSDFNTGKKWALVLAVSLFVWMYFFAAFVCVCVHDGGDNTDTNVRLSVVNEKLFKWVSKEILIIIPFSRLYAGRIKKRINHEPSNRAECVREREYAECKPLRF